MNIERIKEFAIEAGDDWEHTLKEDREFLEKFAALVAAAEREACVELCVLAEKMCKAVGLYTIGVGNYIAAAIRARGNE